MEFLCILIRSLGWEPIFEFEGETLAEMSRLKKVDEALLCKLYLGTLLTEFIESFISSIPGIDEAQRMA